MKMPGQSTPVPEPSQLHRRVPAWDVTERLNRTQLLDAEDAAAAHDAKQRQDGIWLNALTTLEALIPEEAAARRWAGKLERAAAAKRELAEQRKLVRQVRLAAWLPVARHNRREIRALGPVAVVATVMVEFPLALVAWWVLLGGLQGGVAFVDAVLKPAPLIAAIGLAAVSAVAVHLSGMALGEYLERKRIAAAEHGPARPNTTTREAST